MAGRQSFSRVEALPFAGGEIEPEHVYRTNALSPNLSIHVMAQADEVELDAVVVPFGRQRIVFDLPGLRIDRADGALVHGVERESANRTHAPSLLQNTRLSSDVTNPLSRSRN